MFTGDYPFAFNGMEKDDEVKGIGNSLDFGARIYDPRLGRFLSRDPLESNFVSWSTYTAFLDNPILIKDPTGKGGEISIAYDKSGAMTITVTSVIFVYSEVSEIQNDINNLASIIQSNINNAWNGNGFSAAYGDKVGIVNFNVSVVPCASPEEAKMRLEQHRDDPKYNFVHLNTSSVADPGEYTMQTTGNVGSWSINPQYCNTYAHEFGHFLSNRLFESIGMRGKPEPYGFTDHTYFEGSIFKNSQNEPTRNDFKSFNYGLGIMKDGQNNKSIYALKKGFRLKDGQYKKYIGEINIDKIYDTSSEAKSEVEKTVIQRDK